MRCRAIVTIGLISLTLNLTAASASAQTVLWDESVNGDLSNSQAAPNAFALPIGISAIKGTVTGGAGGDSQDWVALTVPTGAVLNSLVLAAYSSTDAQGFTGFQTGATFVGSSNAAGSYTGYAHFGTGATNGSHPVTNLVGQDILSLMADPTVAAGSTGFTTPLGAGSYTFLIQQLGAATSYQFNYSVSPVPEPGSLLLSGLAGLVAVSRWLRRLGKPVGRT